MNQNPDHHDLPRLPRADQPRMPSRQYATLDEFNRAYGDDPDTVEEWLASRYPRVIGRNDPGATIREAWWQT